MSISLASHRADAVPQIEDQFVEILDSRGPQTGNRGPAIVAILTLALIFTTICLAMRVVRMVRFKYRKAEDTSIIVSYVVLLAYAIIIAVSVSYGFGRHLSNIPHRNMHRASELQLRAAPLQAAPILFAKISVGLALLHLGFNWVYKSAIVLAMIFSTLGNLQSLIVIAMICHRTLTDFEGTGQGRQCVPVSRAAPTCYVQGATNIVADLIFVLVPVFFIRKVKFAPRERNIVYITLCFILTSTVLTILKLPLIENVIGDTTDGTYTAFPVTAYALGESACCIIAACLPSMRQMISTGLLRRRQEPTRVTGIISLYTSNQHKSVSGDSAKEDPARSDSQCIVPTSGDEVGYLPRLDEVGLAGELKGEEQKIDA